MTPEDARKLIGGYATGNLADEERKALLAAAISEQDLFDELVKEQALKELLDDPHSRKHLLDQLRPSPERISGGIAGWRWAAAGSLALATVMIAVVMMRTPDKPQVAPVLTATRLPAPAAPPIAPPIAPPTGSLRDMAPKAENKVSEIVDTLAKPKAMDSAPSPAAPAPVAKEEQAKVTTQARMDAGLRFHILRRGANGIFTEAAAETVFDAGDALRVRVEPPAAGILSLSAGGGLLASLPVEANQSYVLPADRPITLDAGSRETRLTLALSPRADRREIREKSAEALSSAGSGAAPTAQARAALSVEIVLHHR